MKKKFLMAAALMCAGGMAMAANPFSDVSSDDWAYQAVADLSDQGIVEGYPDGTFRGQRNMTRYELAQVIARLMAREDQLNAEQRATLDKLAGAYADELSSLGVRVSNLEKKVGNISWSGDARMRYIDNSVDKADTWDGRMRINVKGQVSPSTSVNGRLTTKMWFRDGTSEDGNTAMDLLYVNHKFGNAGVTLGRYANTYGYNNWIYGQGKNFDGAELNYKSGGLSTKVGYGQFNGGKYIKDLDALYARGSYDFKIAKLGVDYLRLHENDKNGEKPEILGATLMIPMGSARVYGEYYKNTNTDRGNDTAWMAGAGYGQKKLKKPGTFQLDLAYYDVGRGVYRGGTGMQAQVIDAVTTKYGPKGAAKEADRVKFWAAQAEVVLLKNTYLHGEYDFAAEAEGNIDPDDSWTVSLNYKF